MSKPKHQNEKITYELLEDIARSKAAENISKWDLQERDLLLLVLLEELGELTQSYLQNKWENGNLNDEYNELYDLMAVLYAYWIRLEWDRYGRYEYDFIHQIYDEEILKPEEPQ